MERQTSWPDPEARNAELELLWEQARTMRETIRRYEQSLAGDDNALDVHSASSYASQAWHGANRVGYEFFNGKHTYDASVLADADNRLSAVVGTKDRMLQEEKNVGDDDESVRRRRLLFVDCDLPCMDQKIKASRNLHRKAKALAADVTEMRETLRRLKTKLARRKKKQFTAAGSAVDHSR